MKKKGAATTSRTRTGTRTRSRKRSAAEFLESPIPMTELTPDQSPIFKDSSKKRQKSMASASSSPTSALFTSPFHPPTTSLASISDLKDMVSSRLGHFKRSIDLSHSAILKDFDAFYSRIHKRFKVQNQECQQVSNEAEREYKNMSERISESQEAMMTSYAEFMADAQARTSHASKISITKLSQSFEKAIDALRSRYGILSA